MSVETVFIAFGSNQGDRQDFCDRAVALMGLLPQSTLTGVSSYYETEPIDMARGHDDTWFYNGVVRLETQLQPEHLLAVCRETERGLGRDPELKHVSRPMDLDVLFYGQRIIDTPRLTVPHPRLHQRRFVLTPMAELDPDWVHPQYKQTMQALLDRLTDTWRVQRLDVVPGSRFTTRPSCAPPPAD
ncbi:MAG: 2-amino-4-hydroxy-6-hydroxymethyldihydropteridine diphosphokinase [Nitrospira sp. SB0672_bin_25]|nr:2-amino-4-hydroxy-6-hydroxymethyldihydropteridine diphosphokinase [Nitrospira sp. SB0672_bin_25]